MTQLLMALAAGSIAIVGGIAKITGGRGLTARATGEVVAYRRGSPVFRFTAAGHGEFEVKSDVSIEGPFPRRRGTVPVVYDPTDPRRARIDAWFYSAWFVGGLMIGVGLLFVLVAGVVLS
jgi:hypothetical protein